MKRVSLQDETGARLEIILEQAAPGRWEAYAKHSVEGRGASQSFTTENLATRAWRRLEEEALKRNWKYVTIVRVDHSSPAAMKLDKHTGERLFRDRFTGELIKDESSSRPPKVTLAPPPLRNTDAFTILTLPVARRA